MNLKQLENVVLEHLKESGEIRAGVKTCEDGVKQCKAGIDRLEGRIWAAAGSVIFVLLGIAGFLLKVSLWK